MGECRDKPARPPKGTICSFAREAALSSGREGTDIKPNEIQCTEHCSHFGVYLPDGRLDKAVGCRRKS